MMQKAFKRAAVRSLTLLCLLGVLLVPASAAVESVGGADYCFTTEDFMTSSVPGSGVYLCEVPEEDIGTLRVGERTLQTGDILPTDALSSVVFHPASATDAVTCLSYYTIYDDKLSDETVMTIELRSGKNQAPIAKDGCLETYKNLPKSGTFDASDPDGDSLTYTIVETPKRGSIQIENDGTFVYTPKENKVGKDSFTYTVTDPSGSVSEEATISVEILKPMDAAAYADMTGDPNEFEALWMRSTGLMEGSQVTGQLCFHPEETVSRGEYLVMAMALSGMKPEDGTKCTFADSEQAPEWMQGYLCSALRQGVIRGMRRADGLCFCPQNPITGAQAAVIAQNILKLDADDTRTVFADDNAIPAWAASSMDALRQAGITLPANAAAPMTRRDCACMLYRMSRLME